MSHVHWSGVATDTIPYDGQDLTIGLVTGNGDPLGTVFIRGSGSAERLLLPNSSASTPTWSAVPGTAPPLLARQDGHYPSTLILIRPAS